MTPLFEERYRNLITINKNGDDARYDMARAMIDMVVWLDNHNWPDGNRQIIEQISEETGHSENMLKEVLNYLQGKDN